ncbi:MAG TPA: ankyrin repeat domain-containing protein [Pseudomonadales bacterium]|nr:ankyrin repeat domain-containing protein [Pseudomonadales bacterium]
MDKSLINFEHDTGGQDNQMGYPRFEALGAGYPFALQRHYERILNKIDTAWDSPDIEEVFSDLIIDRRGGRQGFPLDVLNDIIRLKEFRQSEKLRLQELKWRALQQLEQQGMRLEDGDFMKVLLDGDQQSLDLFLNAGFRFQHLRDKQESTPLLIALKKGYTVCAHMLLKAGDFANAKDALGLTPLLISCGKTTQGYRSITELLLKSGADVGARDPMGNTPLLLALSGGMLDVALLLLQHGADKRACNKAGDSLLTLLEEHADHNNPDVEAIQAFIDQSEG